MKHIVILGGGFAGINLVNRLIKEFGHSIGNDVKITLVDKNSYHFRKVLLFKMITEDVDLKVPFTRYCTNGVEYLKGEVTTIHYTEKAITLKMENEQNITLQYTYLVMALGSVVKEVSGNLGGITLSGMESALNIRQKLQSLIIQAKAEENKEVRKRFLCIAIVGGGITGIETAAELTTWFKEEVRKAGLNSNEVEVILFESKERLLPQLPVKVSKRLVKELNGIGITVCTKTKVKQYDGGQLICVDDTTYMVGECIWTLGVKVNPFIQALPFPLTKENQILVTDTYCIQGYPDIFAIGDCARIVDRKTNEADGMTCKEAIPQAARLSKIFKKEVYSSPHSITHRALPIKLYCVSLGPNNGFVWAQKWGINFTISGKIGARIREKTWDQASLLV